MENSTLVIWTGDLLQQIPTMYTLLVLLAGLVIYYITKLNTEEDIKNNNVPYPQPPGPWAWPVIGNLPQLKSSPHKTMTKFREIYGDIYSLQMGSYPTVVLNGIDVIKQALVKQAEDFAGRPDFYTFSLLADGKTMGFGDYGPRWKLHRKIAQNALCLFINSKDNPIEVAIQDEAAFLVENLTKNSGTPIDPHNEVYLSVGAIICALCFGKRYRRDDADFMKLVNMNADFMAYVGAGNPVDIMPWMRHFTKWSFNNFLRILDTMDKFCLHKRVEHLDTYKDGYLRDVTDALIKTVRDTPEEELNKVGLTDEHILLTVQEMVGAGFDTIATTLQWAILYMAMHPECQTKSQEEIDNVIGQSRLPCYKDWGSLPYTEAFIWETMRLSCIFPLSLPHAATKDTFLGEYFIPDKTLIFTNLWSIHMDETHFPEPHAFKPERFLHEGEVNKDVLESFLPFSAGRRRCPGEILGRMEIFDFIVTILQKCKVSQVPGMKYTHESKYGLTLKPQDFKVDISLRY